MPYDFQIYFANFNSLEKLAYGKNSLLWYTHMDFATNWNE